MMPAGGSFMGTIKVYNTVRLKEAQDASLEILLEVDMKLLRSKITDEFIGILIRLHADDTARQLHGLECGYGL